MKKILLLLLVGVALLGAAYVAGYWPQHTRAGALEGEKAALQQRLDAAEARLRVGHLLGELLTLKEVVQEMNYGQARGISSEFFDHVRVEAARTPEAALKQALEGVLASRDAVTIALTQGDASALGHLREAERRLRQALGWPAPAAVATPAPAVSALPEGSPSPAPGLSPALPASPPATSAPGPLGLPAPSPTPPGD